MKPSPSRGMNLVRDMQYAAIYARVSTEDQGKGFSIPTQLEAGRRLADREGYAVPESYVLIDEGISGTTLDRPGLRQLRELVHARAITAVIVYDPDRLSRNLGHQLLLAEECERAGVRLLIVSYPCTGWPTIWPQSGGTNARRCCSTLHGPGTVSPTTTRCSKSTRPRLTR